MSNLWLKINEDLKNAMRAKDSDRVAVLRMLLAALKNKIIEIGHSLETELPNDISIEVIRSEIKKRKDAISSYEMAKREDLAEKEAHEIEVLEKYMPAMMSAEQIEKEARLVINDMGEVNMKDFGHVMGEVMKKLKGKAEGEMVSQAVKKILS